MAVSRSAHFLLIGQVVHQDRLPTLRMLLIHLLDEGVHRLQVLNLPYLVVIFLNVNELLLSTVFFV